ncbi:MAG: hypothetical protein ACKO63_00625 [Nodosilinea sp.]
MAQFRTPHQAWCDAVKAAIDTDQSIPIPEGAPAMTATERDGWQTHVRQNIHREEPVTPYHWLQAQAQRRDRPTSAQLWGDVLDARLARMAAAAGLGDGGAN